MILLLLASVISFQSVFEVQESSVPVSLELVVPGHDPLRGDLLRVALDWQFSMEGEAFGESFASARLWGPWGALGMDFGVRGPFKVSGKSLPDTSRPGLYFPLSSFDALSVPLLLTADVWSPGPPALGTFRSRLVFTYDYENGLPTRAVAEPGVLVFLGLGLALLKKTLDRQIAAA